MWTAGPVIGQVFVQAADGRHTSDLTHDQRKKMSDAEREEWTYGSQMFLFGLAGYFVILWTLKFNMLCFYSRLVRSLWTEKFVRPLMVIVVLSAVVIILTLALTCRPFYKLWQVWPDPGRKDICLYSTMSLRFDADCIPFDSLLCATESRLLSRHSHIQSSYRHLHHDCASAGTSRSGVHATFRHFVSVLSTNMETLGAPRNQNQWLLFSLGFFCMFVAVLRFVLIFTVCIYTN